MRETAGTFSGLSHFSIASPLNIHPMISRNITTMQDQSGNDRVKIYLKSMEQGDTIKLYKQSLYKPYN